MIYDDDNNFFKLYFFWRVERKILASNGCACAQLTKIRQYEIGGLRKGPESKRGSSGISYGMRISSSFI